MRNKRNKGFTLVEILAAITILGILSAVAIVSVNKVIQNAKSKHYTTAEEQLKLAGQSYIQQNRSKLPKSIGQMVKIPLRTLVTSNYIEEIKDYSKKECDLDKSYVQVFKYSQTEYSYTSYLKCPTYSSANNMSGKEPTITASFTGTSGDVAPAVSLKIVDDNKLMSYSYIIYQNNVEVYNSGNVAIPSYDSSFSKTVDLNGFIPGKIKVSISATNALGVSKTITKSSNYKDETGPVCIVNEEDQKPKAWTNQPRKITVRCSDGNGTGCERTDYSKTFSTTTKEAVIEIKDKAGNTTDCKVTVYVDTDLPTCSVTFNGTKGENGWHKSSVTVKLSRKDDTSGIKAYGLNTTGNTDFNSIELHNQGDTATQTWYGYVQDVAGNVNRCQSTVKVDTVKPLCNITLDGVVGNNGWYKERSVNVNINATDATSGVSDYGSATSKTAIKYNKKASLKQGDTTENGVTWYATVKDAAGNESEICQSPKFKVDATAPTLTFNPSPSTVHQSNTGIVVSTTCKDTLSGVATKSDNVAVASPTPGTNVNQQCTDNAGNLTNETKQYKVQTFSRNEQCGVEKYKECTNEACGTYQCSCEQVCTKYTCEWCRLGRCGMATGYSECAAIPDGKFNEGCKSYGQSCSTCNNKCRTAACGIELYRECWHY